MIEQERVEDVQLEGKTFKGKFAEFPDTYDAMPKKDKKKEKKKKKNKVKKEELWLRVILVNRVCFIFLEILVIKYCKPNKTYIQFN